MDRPAIKQGVDKYLEPLFRSSASQDVLSTLETEEVSQVSTSRLALQIVLDLYNENSAHEANVNRITTNLEAAAEELLHMSKLIRALPQD